MLEQHIGNEGDTLKILNNIDQEINSVLKINRGDGNGSIVRLGFNQVKLNKFGSDDALILDIDLDKIEKSISCSAEEWTLVNSQSKSENKNTRKKFHKNEVKTETFSFGAEEWNIDNTQSNNHKQTKEITEKKKLQLRELIKTEDIENSQTSDDFVFEESTNISCEPPAKKKGRQSRRTNGPIVLLQDSVVVIQGLACKSCQFYATDIDLMSEHLVENHNMATNKTGHPDTTVVHADHPEYNIELGQYESLSLRQEIICETNFNLNNNTTNTSSQDESSLDKKKETMALMNENLPLPSGLSPLSSELSPLPSELLPLPSELLPLSKGILPMLRDPLLLLIDDQAKNNGISTYQSQITGSNFRNDKLENDNVNDNFDYPPDMVKMEYIQSKGESTEDSAENVTCWFCKNIFNDVNVLNQHIDEIHYQKNTQLNSSSAPLTVVNSNLFCFICNIQFERRYVYNEHEVRNHAEKKYPCDQCDRSFPRPSFLNDHVRKMHLLCKLECQFCKKVMANIATLRFHLLLVHEYKMIKTDPLVFFTKPSSIAPADKETAASNQSQGGQSENPDQTAQASGETPVKDFDGQDNTNTEADVPVLCDQCDKEFKTPRNLRKHKAAVHDAKTIMCPDCGDLFSREFLLQSHVRYTHNLKVNVACQHCNEVLANEKTMYNHIRVFHKDKRYECKLCSQYFATKDGVKEHSKQFHPEVSVFKCPTCDEEFSCHSSLFIHRKKVHQLKMFSCNQCEKSFATDWQLRNHCHIVHQGENPNKSEIVCNYCQQNFSLGYHLKRHIITKHKEAHEYEINFECITCNQQFSDKWHLNRHNASKHADPNITKCQFCLETCATREDLRMHLETKHKVECNLCSKMLSCNQHLKRHMLSIHSNPEERKKDHMTRQECDLCCKPFFDKWSLNRHIRNVHKINKGN